MCSVLNILVAVSFLQGFVAASNEIDFKPCIKELTNGCSIPLNLPFPYKDVFLPACERHDVCYQCGPIYKWSREQCDNAFKANMLTLCKLKEDSTKVVTYSGGFWDKLRSIFKVATAMAKWILTSPGTLEHCVRGSDTYYTAVDGFAHSNYGSGDPGKCKLPCAAALGDPGNVI